MRRSFLNSDRGVGLFEVLALFLLFAFGAFVFYGYCQEERITLTTYYPAPFAIYRDLNVTRTLNMSVASAANPNNGIFFNGPVGGGMIRGWANQLLIEVSNNAANSIYMGSTTGCGMILENDGDMYVCGEMLGESTGAGHGCIIMTYSSFSGVTQCPAGFVVDLVKSGAPTGVGGIFYCCK